MGEMSSMWLSTIGFPPALSFTADIMLFCFRQFKKQIMSSVDLWQLKLWNPFIIYLA